MNYQYITGYRNEDFFDDVKRGMNDAAQDFSVEVSFLGVDDGDTQALSRLIDDAIRAGVDGLAVNIVHPTRLHDALLRCKEAGIPVVTFNIDGETQLRLATVSQNFHEAGMALGKLMCQRVRPGEEILITQHDAGISALDERAAGICEALRARDVRVRRLVAGNTPEIAKASILQVLAENRAIGTILGTGQSDTHGAGLAALALPERTLTIAGFDVCEDILQMLRSGVITATVEQQPYIQGYFPLLLLHQYVCRGMKPFDINTGNSILQGCISG